MCTAHDERGGFVRRIDHFLHRPWTEKREILKRHARQAWFRVMMAVPLPILKRVEPGFIWIVSSDAIRGEILNDTFEKGERAFLQRFLKAGMNMVDVGAYHGLYCLAASLKVGGKGRVIAFEPSPYQRRRLRLHLTLNRLSNVTLESAALGARESQATLFAIRGARGGYSSLRTPSVIAPARHISVPLTTLDVYLEKHPVKNVDLMKVDVEGGELDVFRGATGLLQRKPRPVIICELEDVRTEAWGHKAKDTALFVEDFGFTWFRPLPCGALGDLKRNGPYYERNFIAVPQERLRELREMIE